MNLPEDKNAVAGRTEAGRGILESYDDKINVGLQDSKCSEPRTALGGQDEGEQKSSTRPTVVITSYRTRLLDRDNLYRGTKSLLDAIRYSGAIRDDSEKEIVFEARQVKVAHRVEEKTVIEIEV